MKIGLSTQAVIGLCFFTLVVSPVLSQNCQKNADNPGYQTISQVIGAETIVREYILQIPTSYDPAVSSSLIINMHGFGGCAVDHAEAVGKFYEFDDLANQENIIVAYPQGAYRADKDDHYWEPGDNGEMDIYKNDVYFIEELVANIASDYNIDMNRVYAAGYSNGGMMAYSLACNRNELFAGIGIMSGVMLEEECNQNYSIPIVVFHGIADGVLPYEGNQWYRSTQEIVNYWLDKNNIPSSSLVSTELKDGAVIRDEYSGGNENSCLSFYTINEEYDKPGDHVWFGEAIEGSTPNEILWDFFSNNCGNTISTEETQQEENINIYPNPFSEKVTVQSMHTTGKSYDIYNSQGIKVKSGEINQSQTDIELSDLMPNIYLIRIDGTLHKLIKTK